METGYHRRVQSLFFSQQEPLMTTQASADAPMYYQKATAHTRRLLAAVTPDQWEASTPCIEWNLKQLVNHMVSGAKNVAAIMGGDGPQNFGEVLGEDPIAAFDTACKAAIAAFSAPGVMGSMVHTRRGEQLAGDYALGQVQEMLVHGWDLATATGADTTMDPELLDVSYARAVRSRDRLRTGGSTAWGESEVAAAGSTDTQTKYLAILGRST
jgi:uncharacterized protein (TIGR03086 family)